MAVTPQDADSEVTLDGGFDPYDFRRRLRGLARDAHQILNRPDSSMDDLIALHSCVWFLLGEASGSQSTAIRQWLLAVRQAIAVKFQSWSPDELESWEA
jgi:hypothetical protein